MEIGLVGLPNAGKSTLFNALTNAGAEVASYAFTTIEANVGIVSVPDVRFDKVVELIKPKKVVQAVVKFVDIAGLVKGASKGEGLGNKFLSHIRNVDAIAQVVRCFEGEVPRVENQKGAVVDIDTVNTELALADINTCEKRAEKLEKLAKSGDKESIKKSALIKELIRLLSDGGLAGNYKEIDEFRDLNLLTAKPTILVANISEEKLRAGDYSEAEPVKNYAKKHNKDVIVLSAKIEAELAELSDEDAQVFRKELSLEETGLSSFIKTSYQTLGLISFFTTVSDESRAWTLRKGESAVAAAGKIHTDMARGFIKAEVINYERLLNDGSMSSAREKGHVRMEGKEYVVQDGDVIHFKFNV